MKKQILFLLTAGFSLYQCKAQQQQLPNSGFEQWTTVNTIEEPTSWFTINSLYPGNATKASLPADVHNGSFAIKISTVDIGENQATPAAFSNSDLLNEGRGMPFSSRPDSIVFWEKHNVQGNDTIFTSFSLKKNNGSSQINIGNAEAAVTSSSQNTYERVSLPFNYSLSDTPDTIKVLFFVGQQQTLSGVFGNYLYIDDISLIYNPPPVSVNEKVNSNFTIYPSPTSGELFISTEENIYKTIVTDLTGRVVFEKVINNEKHINLSDLYSGIYSLTLIANTGEAFTKKIHVLK